MGIALSAALGGRRAGHGTGARVAVIALELELELELVVMLLLEKFGGCARCNRGGLGEGSAGLSDDLVDLARGSRRDQVCPECFQRVPLRGQESDGDAWFEGLVQYQWPYLGVRTQAAEEKGGSFDGPTTTTTTWRVEQCLPLPLLGSLGSGRCALCQASNHALQPINPVLGRWLRSCPVWFGRGAADEGVCG